MFDDVVVVYKFVADLMFYVTGSQDDNELILATVLQAFYESVSLLLRQALCSSCQLSDHGAHVLPRACPNTKDAHCHAHLQAAAAQYMQSHSEPSAEAC